MRLRGQNAIEFLTTYGFVLLILTIAISLVFVLASGVGRAISPAQCTIYGGFSCTQVVYTTNTANTAISQFFLIATDTQPGIVNVSSFSVSIGTANSVSGLCAPSAVTSGQNIYCLANVIMVPNVGTIYSSNFDLYANYCTQNATTANDYICSSNSNFTYAGSARVTVTKTNVILP
jgi:hypothetical protein